MPFSKSPTLDTYSSERVQLYREMSTRDGGTSGKDEDFLNVYIEAVKQKAAGDTRKFIVKRAGTSAVIPSVGAGSVRGMYFWTDQHKLFYCVGRNVYVYNVLTNTSTTLTNVFTTTTGVIGFCEYLYDNGSVVICATDGSAVSGLVTISDSNVVVTNTDTDLPAHLPYPVFLDGYLFVGKLNSADIYNSDLNNPLSWTVGTFISAEMEADLIVRIAKLNNYLVVFGSETIEYFWDAGGVAPNSPLQRNDSPIKINTYIGGYAIYGNTIYYIGTDAGGQADIFMLKDFKIESIGTPAMSRYLTSATDGVANWSGNVLSFSGHTFYVVTAGANKTYAGDLDNKLWTRWSFQQRNVFNILFSTTVANTYNSQSYFVLNDGTTTVYSFNKDLFQDAGVNYTCSIVSENNDFGTLNRKTMKRLSIVADRPATNANMLLSWSDDDYQSFNVPVACNLNQDNACVYRLGSFRQRVFKLTFTENEFMRLQEIEVDINKGNS